MDVSSVSLQTQRNGGGGSGEPYYSTDEHHTHVEMDLETLSGAEGLWVDLIKAKYLRDRDIFAVETPTKGS
jgi:hypothetical protein